MPTEEKEAPISIEASSDNSAKDVEISIKCGGCERGCADCIVLGEDVTELAKSKKVTGRTIAIVGFAETSRMQVLAEPPETEIWSLNRCYVFLKRWDRWFELHEPDLYTGATGLREEGYVQMLKDSNVPIYMQHPDPQFPTAVQFPRDEIVAMFRDYFTTSIAYMLALVAYEHKLGQTVSEMHMYGVDMSAFSEYSEQLPSVNYWLGVLEGLGIKVVIPSVSPILKCAMSYGQHNERPLQKMAKERLAHHKNQRAQLNADMNAAAGAGGEYTQVFKALDELKAEIAKNEQPYDVLIDRVKEWCETRRNEINKFHAQMNADLNAELGAEREVQHWIVALNAAQTAEEEPEAAKMPSIG